METMTKEQRELAKKAFPEYKGRKFKADVRSRYFMQDYWSEGSRNYVVAVDIATGRVGAPYEFTHNPMNAGAHATVAIPPGVALIEHAIFCGKDCGLTFITGENLMLEDTAPGALPWVR